MERDKIPFDPDFFLRLRVQLSTNQMGGSMGELVTKSSLSVRQRRLLEMMSHFNFCRIENLEIRDGQPVFEPAPRVIQDIKIGGENGPRPELEKDDFLLRTPIIELFEHLNRLGDGRIAVIEVRYGLPFRLTVEQPASGGSL